MIRRVDDLLLLALVVDAGSFTAASIVSGMSKSLLSRRISEFEAELGVQLIERTTRSFQVTDVGERLYRHACAIRSEREAAITVVNDLLVSPTGPLCIVCPVILAEEVIGEIAVAFAARYPAVQLTFDVVNGMPNVHPEHYDIMFLPSYGDLPDSEAIARHLITTPYELVAAPGWIENAGTPQTADALQGLGGIGWWQAGTKPIWRLAADDGTRHDVPIRSSLLTNNLAIARMAALAGVGMARLPRPICRRDLAEGRLMRVVPGLAPDPITIHVAYPSRRSLTAAGRAFLSLLDESSAALQQFGEVSNRARRKPGSR